MPKPFDPTKPVQLADGTPARIICTDKKGAPPIAAFRIIKEHREPREFWLIPCDAEDNGGWIYDRKEEAVEASGGGLEVVHVREVLEDQECP